ncbi:MAG: fumarylacetoacetase [Flavobacteriales bacterium]|jgi:fumarylacetoacetase|nr:fumarylacetoacetase [Flavobacteriales bacterium]MBK6882648.1 fumarylacetoacetase [Flavobacteriales bacterium]MBK7101120.1 fumarylacetoacetase [Flavobacteriales bacterium]MBK7111843.1 fumarylacetoacetase [Flavobacteriales bacterium]MBK7619128.1 fumarylacetoacetase [Flavobacteriales bacterium]
MTIPANSPTLRSWIPVAKDSDFPIQNIPFGIASWNGEAPVPATRIGDTVIDLSILADMGLLDGLGHSREAFLAPNLNALMAGGKQGIRALRQRLSELLQEGNATVRDDNATREDALLPLDQVTMHLPVEVGDYTDFYSSREHATNVGSLFRDPANALFPNWLHLPVGYHGRASSLIASGTPIHRPMGQTRPDPQAPPIFGPTKQLDLELEMGFFTFDGKPLGQRISTAEADEHIFGLVLFNDWSARDIQSWEYVPLGPFLAKNFASSMSAWVVTLDALEPFRIPGPVQDPAVLPYLKADDGAFDIALEAALAPEGGEATTICRTNFKHLYWSMAQQLAHHTVNGCNIRRGDLMASGTISGSTPDSFGSMLELTWRGTKPLTLANGEERKFIADGDTLILRGHAQKDGLRIGFGTLSTKVLPVVPFV